ncbi:MAG: winged helix DNA-binding domain-containing protein [Chloroflexota bacterium]|nr:winged helix DNA-binding domain-containing protein [Chloroflexota bacterium]
MSEQIAPGAAKRARRGTGDVLSQRALNRATLARQLLFAREKRPAIEVIQHLAGMQAQNPLDPYYALWSRLEAFQPAELAALLTGRQAVRTALLRTTIHLVTAGDCLAMRPMVQHILERVFWSTSFAKNIKGINTESLLALGRTVLTEQPRTGPALGKLLAERWPEYDPASLAYAVRYILPLVQIPPRGIWGQGGQATWATVETWLGRPVATATAPDALVPRYLAAFGPASVMDMQNWSGLTRLSEIFDRLRPRLRAFHDEAGVELFDLPEAPRPDPETPAPPRFFPEYDNLFLGHADRARIVPPGRGSRHVAGYAFTVDGFFRGVWKFQRTKATTTLLIDPFDPLSPAEEAALLDEARGLLAFATPETAHAILFTRIS